LGAYDLDADILMVYPQFYNEYIKSWAKNAASTKYVIQAIVSLKVYL